MRFSKVDVPEPASLELVVLFASYEERCLRTAHELAERGYDGRVIVLHCADLVSARTDENIATIKALFGAGTEIRGVSVSSPVAAIEVAISTDWPPATLIDVSCFNRENLFAFLWATRLGLTSFPPWLFSYSAPDDYGSWLSRDYGPAHNLVGFGGSVRPSHHRHLFAVVGYESDRALAIIRALEPSSVTLAVGTIPTRDEFFERNATAVKRLLGSDSFEVCSIDVSDPEASRTSINEALEHVAPDASIHVAPFSTKLSCLGIYALWQQNQQIRVWSAQPEIYNMAEYSRGSTPARFFAVEWDEPNAAIVGL